MDVKEKLLKLGESIHNSIICKQKVWDSRSGGQWDKLWSSYYVLLNTQKAIEEWKNKNDPQNLEMYGILQALYVQQDALRHAQEAVDVDVIHIKNEYQDLYDIRKTRDQLAGHPSKTTLKRDKSNFSEGTLTYTMLGYNNNSKVLRYSVSSGKGDTIKSVDILKCIKTQEIILKKEIDKIIIKINEIDRDHKLNFNNMSLREKINITTYLASKAYSFEKDIVYSKISFCSLKEIFEDFKIDVCKRFNVKSINKMVDKLGLQDQINHIDKMIPRVEKMLLNRNGIDNFDLDVYVKNLVDSFGLLQKMAEEIDNEFSSI